MQMHKTTATVSFAVLLGLFFPPPFFSPLFSLSLSLSLSSCCIIDTPLCCRFVLYKLTISAETCPFWCFLIECTDTLSKQIIFWGWGGCYLYPVLMLVLTEVNAWDVLLVVQYGRQFVDVFLLRGMPVLDATFTSHSVDVHSLLRSLQQSTRTLQNMCSHAKVGCDIFTCFVAFFLFLFLLSPKLIFVLCL